MTRLWPHRPHPSRIGAGLLAALMIQGAWWALLRMERSSERRREALTEIRLLTAPEPARREPPPPRSQAPAPGAYRPPITIVPVPLWTLPTESTAPPPSAAPQSGGLAAPASAGVPPVSGPAPLRLSLPPRPASAPWSQSMMDQVRNDPRSHSERRTLEHRMADAMGTLPTVVQSSTSGTGSALVRRGSACTRVYENRMKSLAPMDDRLKDAPSISSNC